MFLEICRSRWVIKKSHWSVIQGYLCDCYASWCEWLNSVINDMKNIRSIMNRRSSCKSWEIWLRRKKSIMIRWRNWFMISNWHYFAKNEEVSRKMTLYILFIDFWLSIWSRKRITLYKNRISRISSQNCNELIILWYIKKYYKRWKWW